jgi:hypothetical protein
MPVLKGSTSRVYFPWTMSKMRRLYILTINGMIFLTKEFGGLLWIVLK